VHDGVPADPVRREVPGERVQAGVDQSAAVKVTLLAQLDEGLGPRLRRPFDPVTGLALSLDLGERLRRVRHGEQPPDLVLQQARVLEQRLRGRRHLAAAVIRRRKWLDPPHRPRYQRRVFGHLGPVDRAGLTSLRASGHGPRPV
jgi:hypothetical protein